MSKYYIYISGNVAYRISAKFEPSAESRFLLPALECDFPAKVRRIENTTLRKLRVEKVYDVYVNENPEYDYYQILMGNYGRQYDAKELRLKDKEFDLERKVIIIGDMDFSEALSTPPVKRKTQPTLWQRIFA